MSEVKRLPGTSVAQRIMPDNHWDWSIPVPFSQGWKCGDLIFVGGQISSDSTGKTIGAGDIETQTRNVFQNIRTVLQEVDADMDDIVKFNTYYCFEAEGEEVRERVEDAGAERAGGEPSREKSQNRRAFVSRSRSTRMLDIGVWDKYLQ